VRAWTYQILDALAYIHGRGVLHRDISPQNLILTDEGRVMLVDFGLVKAWDASNPVTRTAIRGLGKAEYSPPEQYNMTGEHTAPSSDIYALGATLYHLVTGQAPPSVTDRMANPEGFAKPRLLKKQVSEQMESVILKAMEISRKDRFQSAQEMRRAIKGESIRTAASDQGTNVPGYYLLILAFLGLVAVGIIVWSVMGGKERATPTPTRAETLTATATPVPPTATPSVTPSPSAVPATETPAPTVTPIVTSAPVPPTSTAKVVATRRPTPAPAQATAVPESVTAPRLLGPGAGETLDTSVNFRWQGGLGTGQSFLVTVRHVESGFRWTSDRLSMTSWTTLLPADRFGEWRWYVQVVQGDTVLTRSEERHFWLDPFPGGGGSSGPEEPEEPDEPEPPYPAPTRAP